MNLTHLQKQALAKKYLSDHNISFGNSAADDKAVEIYVAGIEELESQYNAVYREFKDAYISIFKFHCEELRKEWDKSIKQQLHAD